MKELILGEMIFVEKYNSFCTLKRHININDWKNFIRYIEKYEKEKKE